MSKMTCKIFKNDDYILFYTPEKNTDFMTAIKECGQAQWNVDHWQLPIANKDNALPIARRNWKTITRKMTRKQISNLRPAKESKGNKANRKQNETRRKILIGHAMLKAITKDPELAGRFHSILDQELTANRDRILFGLPEVTS